MRNILVGAYYNVGKWLATRYAPSEVDLFDFQRRFGDVADIFQGDPRPVTVTWYDDASERFAATALVRLQGRSLNARHCHANVLDRYALPDSRLLGVVYTYADIDDESVGVIKHAADELRSRGVGETYILRIRPFGVARYNGHSAPRLKAVESAK